LKLTSPTFICRSNTNSFLPLVIHRILTQPIVSRLFSFQLALCIPLSVEAVFIFAF
jgi:hypothetical protein